MKLQEKQTRDHEEQEKMKKQAKLKQKVIVETDVRKSQISIPALLQALIYTSFSVIRSAK